MAKRTQKIQRTLSSRGRSNITRATKAVLADAAHNVRQRLEGVQGGIMVYAKRNPLKTMGFSVMTGMIIAQLLRLRK